LHHSNKELFFGSMKIRHAMTFPKGGQGGFGRTKGGGGEASSQLIAQHYHFECCGNVWAFCALHGFV